MLYLYAFIFSLTLSFCKYLNQDDSKRKKYLDDLQKTPIEKLNIEKFDKKD